MLKVAQKLDYNLQAYQERLGLVNFLIETGQLDGYPPSELDKVANYLLYAEDVDAEVELKQGNKRKISYEELIESTLGEGVVQSQQDLSVYRVPKPKIDRELDKINNSISILKRKDKRTEEEERLLFILKYSKEKIIKQMELAEVKNGIKALKKIEKECNGVDIQNEIDELEALYKLNDIDFLKEKYK